MGSETRLRLDHLGPNVLDRVVGPVQISAHRTTLERLDKPVTSFPWNVQVSHHHAEKSAIYFNLVLLSLSLRSFADFIEDNYCFVAHLEYLTLIMGDRPNSFDN